MRSTTGRCNVTRRSSKRNRLAVVTGTVGVLGATSLGLTAPSVASAHPLRLNSTAGHTFVAAVATVEGNVDPLDWDGQAHQDYTPLWAATLLQYKPLSPNSTVLPLPSASNLEGELATSVTRDAAGLVFHLRAAKSQYGNELNCTDVQWSIDRMLYDSGGDPSGVGVFLMGLAGVDISSKSQPVTALNPTTCQLALKYNQSSESYFSNYLSGFVLDAAAAKMHATAKDPWANAWLADHSDSFGPYEVESFQPNVQITLAANPYYYGTKPYYTNVIIRAVADAGTRYELIRSGQAQLARGLTLAQFRSIEQSPGGLQTVQWPTLNWDSLFLEETYKPLASPLVRQAISLAINRNALSAGPYRGVGVIMHDQFPQSFPQPASAAPDPLPYNPTLAKKLLTEAGYPHGFTLPFYISVGSNGNTDTNAVAVLIASQLAQVGINATITNVPSYTEFTANQRAKKYPMALVSDSVIQSDALYVVSLLFETKSVSNVFGFSDPRVDALYNKGFLLPYGSAQRNAVVAQVIKLLNQDMPSVPLVGDSQIEVFQKGITGYRPSPYGGVPIYALHPTS